METQTKKTPKKPTMQPEKTFREGAIAASIWRRQAPSGYVYFDYSISRSWKAQTTDKKGYSSNFFVSNEAALIQVVGEATRWIAAASAEDPEIQAQNKAFEAAKKAA